MAFRRNQPRDSKGRWKGVGKTSARKKAIVRRATSIGGTVGFVAGTFSGAAIGKRSGLKGLGVAAALNGHRRGSRVGRQVGIAITRSGR